MTVGARIRAELAARREGQRRPKRLAKGGGDPGSIRLFATQVGWSYGQTYAIVKEGKQPSDAFLRDAAGVLNLRREWLATGQGPRTDHAAEILRVQEARAIDGLTLLHRPSDVQVLADLDLGTPNETRRRRAAVLRFAHKLHDAEHPSAPFSDPDLRAEVMRAAARFLVECEAALDAAAILEPADRPLARTLYSDGLAVPVARVDGRYAVWADMILTAFADRIIGLGEYDAASPSNARRKR